MRRRTKVALAGAVAVVLGGGAAVGAPYILDSQSESTGEVDETGMRSASVQRGSLAQGTILSGTLTRGQPLPLNATGGGVLTWLPDPGTTLGSGDRVFESNGRPTFLLYGKIPLWRPLQSGDRGKDVRSLNEALADAGFLDRSLADDVFGSGTSSALAKLFESAGYEPPSRTEEGRKAIAKARKKVEAATKQLGEAEKSLDAARTGSMVSPSDAEGTVETSTADVTHDVADAEEVVAQARGKVTDATADLKTAQAESITPQDVIILAGDGMRVSSVPLRIGDTASGTVLELTETTVRAEASVTRSQQASLAAGDTVQVTLPDGDTVPGTIVATGGGSGAQGGGADEGAGAAAPEGGAEDGADGVTVVVEIEAQDKVADMTGSAVRIEVTAASVEDVLIVPVTALVALAEGGYAVEKVMPDSPPGTGTLVPVEVGLVAEARVQVTSSQLGQGDEVLIP